MLTNTHTHTHTHTYTHTYLRSPTTKLRYIQEFRKGAYRREVTYHIVSKTATTEMIGDSAILLHVIVGEHGTYLSWVVNPISTNVKRDKRRGLKEKWGKVKT